MFLGLCYFCQSEVDSTNGELRKKYYGKARAIHPKCESELDKKRNRELATSQKS